MAEEGQWHLDSFPLLEGEFSTLINDVDDGIKSTGFQILTARRAASPCLRISDASDAEVTRRKLPMGFEWLGPSHSEV